MSDRSTRLSLLQQALKERILILDGGMGTMIQSYKLDEADYRGDRFADWPQDVKGNNDLLLLSRPDVIQAIEKAYLDAGADILETNTFNATRVSQADYGMEELVYELNVAGARLAREVADAKTLETPERRVSSPASWARPAAPARSPRTSTILATATSPSMNWWKTTPRPLAV